MADLTTDELCKRISEILQGALSGDVEAYWLKQANGSFIRWGRVEADMHAAIRSWVAERADPVDPGGPFGPVYKTPAEMLAAIYESTNITERDLSLRVGPMENAWRPWGDAPQDGSEVLVKVPRAGSLVVHHQPGGHCIEDHPAIAEGWYFWTGYQFAPIAATPTHWAALP